MTDAPKPDETVVAVDKEVKPDVVETEKEEDEPENTSERYTGSMMMNPLDGTLNVLVSGNVVAPLPTDGLVLLAACRANVGITHGRYLVEFEIIQTSGQADIRLGFSTDSASVFLGDKQTLCFNAISQYMADGEMVKTFRGKRFTKGDVVGLLLNRTDAGHAMTISIFVNGVRSGEPQPIPDTCDGALYPHVSVKHAVVAVNWGKTAQKKLPFNVRMIGDASNEHITASHMDEVTETTVILPFGFKTGEMIEEYIQKHPNDSFVEITREFLQQWREKSGTGKGLVGDDTLRSFIKVMTLRKRNYIFGNNHFMLAKDREDFCSHFSAAVKKVALVSSTVIGNLANNIKFANQVSLPSPTEGFSSVNYTTNESDCKDALGKWLKACKLASKVEDLKCGDWFKEQVSEYQKLRDATKADVAQKKVAAAKTETPKDSETKEEPSSIDTSEFAEEDWMLCDLRVELHLLVHAFRSDVEDKERFSFCPEQLHYYYRLYFNNTKSFSHQTYGVKTSAEALDIIGETVSLEGGMLKTHLSKDAEFDTIIQQTKTARQDRLDRIGAGDEGSQLKFKARRQMPSDYRGSHPIKPRFSDHSARMLVPLPFREGKGRPPPSKSSGGSSNYTMRPIPAAASMKRAGDSAGPPSKRTA